MHMPMLFIMIMLAMRVPFLLMMVVFVLFPLDYFLFFLGWKSRATVIMTVIMMTFAVFMRVIMFFMVVRVVIMLFLVRIFIFPMFVIIVFFGMLVVMIVSMGILVLGKMIIIMNSDQMLSVLLTIASKVKGELIYKLMVLSKSYSDIFE